MLRRTLLLSALLLLPLVHRAEAGGGVNRLKLKMLDRKITRLEQQPAGKARDRALAEARRKKAALMGGEAAPPMRPAARPMKRTAAPVVPAGFNPAPFLGKWSYNMKMGRKVINEQTWEFRPDLTGSCSTYLFLPMERHPTITQQDFAWRVEGNQLVFHWADGTKQTGKGKIQKVEKDGIERMPFQLGKGKLKIKTQVYAWTGVK